VVVVEMVLQKRNGEDAIEEEIVTKEVAEEVMEEVIMVGIRRKIMVAAIMGKMVR
jgi:hypothetical protein